METNTSETRIYLDLSPELEAILSDNYISIADILQNQKIEAKVTSGLIPDERIEDARSKDIVTIILATSVATLAIGTAISQVLSTLYRKPYYVEYYDLVELKDEKGNLLLDKKGNPRLKRIKKYKLVEPRKEDVEKSFEMNWKPEHGIVIKIGSKRKQLDNTDNP